MSSTLHFPRFHLSRHSGKSQKSDKQKEKDAVNPHQSISSPFPLNSPLPGTPPSMQNHETLSKKKRRGTIQRSQISAPIQLLSTTNSLAKNGFDLKTMGFVAEENKESRSFTPQSGSSGKGGGRASEEDPSTKNPLVSTVGPTGPQYSHKTEPRRPLLYQFDRPHEDHQKLTVDTNPTPRPPQQPSTNSPIGLAPATHSRSSASVVSSTEASPSPTSTTITSYSNTLDTPFSSPESKPSNTKVNLAGSLRIQPHGPGSQVSSSRNTGSQFTQGSGDHEKHIHPLSQVTTQGETADAFLQTLSPPPMMHEQAPASPAASNYGVERPSSQATSSNRGPSDVPKLSLQTEPLSHSNGSGIPPPPPSPRQERNQHEHTHTITKNHPLHHNDNDNYQHHHNDHHRNTNHQQQQPGTVGPYDLDHQIIERLGLSQFSAQDYIEDLQDLIKFYLDGSSTWGFMKVQAF